MNAVSRQIRLALRLHFRNTMAVVYNYLFPTMFLVAFWALYRYERPPVQSHMGELLTVTILGGACFGLPTTMVSERERGVWRRYRLLPASTTAVVTSTLTARYVMLLLAGLLQIALAVGIGMPLPERPVDLLVAFTCAAIAFMGLGLVIAMVADNVPAVQALGQSVFLPMLVIGGVAVPLSRLPEWAQTFSSYLPGRYAVQAIQASVNGPGVAGSGFSIAALLIIGAAACLAASRLFRWDAQERFAVRGRMGWVAAALVPWLAIGALAESRDDAPPADTAIVSVEALTRPLDEPAESGTQPVLQPSTTPDPPPAPTSAAPTSLAPISAAPATESPQPPPDPPAASLVPQPVAVAPAPPPTWSTATVARIEADIVFDRLPPDDAVVTPLARVGERVDPALVDQLASITEALESWPPGLVADREQRARNLLYVAGVIDLLQLPTEPYVPRMVFERLQKDIPRDDLVKILYWIALHWASGEHAAIGEIGVFGIDAPPDDADQVRNRASIYAVKLLGRLTGKIAD